MLKAAERHCSSRLLIVDDDSAQLCTLAAIMQDEGVDVLPCATAGEALGHLEHGAIGVAIVDLRLPDLSGTRLLEKIREMNSQVRVVIHTGYGSFESAKRAVNLDAFAFVEKLSDPAELIGYVHRAFRDRLDCYTDGLEAEMAKRERVEEELDRHRRHLEELVKERTVELTESNEQLQQEITERKRAAEERLQLKGQLLQAQKMEAVGQLAAGVAHGFRNLLTVITGYAALARSILPADHKAVKSLDGVANAAQQAAGVIRSLLTFSQKTTVPKEPIELHGLVERSVHMLRRMLPAAIEVVTDPADQGPVWIHADGTQVQQVVMNLAVNARDAMPNGGTLRILVTPTPERISQPVASAGSETPGPDTRLPGPVARLVVRARDKISVAT